MANNEIHARIKNKVNPALSSVLLDGELAVLRANGKTKLKIGNGSSALSDIAYVEAPWDEVSAWADQAKSAVSVDGTKADINVQHISQSDYEQLVVTSCVLSNTVYIVSRDYLEAYGQQLKNLAPATDLSDAVNLEQLNSLSSKFYQLPIDGIPGSDMALSVQTALEKAEASISSVPDPVDPQSATLSGYYADALLTKNAILGTQLSTQLSIDALSAWADQAKSAVSVDGIKTDINIQHISQEDYAALVATSCELSDTIYIVSGNYIEAYGLQMKNLAPATDLSDAVNLEQVSSMIASSASETLSSIEQSDWSQSLSTEQSYIKNKPTSLPSPNALSIGTGLSAIAYDGSTPMSLVAGQNIVFAKSGNEISVNAQPFPDPIDPSFAVSSGDYADALAIKNAISSAALSICMLSSWMDQAKSTVSADGVKSDINIQHISQEDYESLVDDGHVLSNTVYIISGDYVEAYGQQMKNLAPGTELSDAVNLEQLNSLSSKFYQLPVNGIPGSDMRLSVQNALEKASVAISSIPSPVDPMSATLSGQYADALATKNALSIGIADMLSTELDRQFDAKIPYLIIEPEISGTTSMSVQLQNYAINSISASSSTTQMVLIFPQKIIGKSRDFYVRLTLSSTTSIPTMTFQEQDSSNVSFDAGNDSWADIDSGVNLLLFTETAQ